MTANSLSDYVNVVSALLLDKPAIHALSTDCKVSATRYSAQNMARNFADGIMRCLELPILRARE
jgi:L-malate glycosyltransferase